MATLIDARLYLPEDWCDDDLRCKKAAIPEDNRQFQSKTQLALAMLGIAKQRGIQFGYVGIEGGVTARNRLFCGLSMNKAADL